MKTLLINPSYPSYPLPYLPVGLGYISESLKSHGLDHDVIDLNYRNIDELNILLKKYRYDYVCFSLTSLDILNNYNLIEDIKKEYSVQIIVGGPHASFVRGHVLEECHAIDCTVIHEGEYVLPRIIKGEPLCGIPGVVYRGDNNRIIVNSSAGFIPNLDDLPFPKYDKFELASYGSVMSLASSRGCPFSCIFCGAHLSMGKKWRYRSLPKVVEEISYWYERGFRSFRFIDSEFFASSERVVELSSALSEYEGKITFSSDGMRADSVNEDVVLCAKKFGLTSVSMGIESANDDILRNIKKGEDLKGMERALRTLGQYGLSVQAFFIMGLPGETFWHVLRSFFFSMRFRNISNVHFFNVNPLYGTELYKWAVENDFLISKDRHDMYRNIGGMSNKVMMKTETLSVWEMKILQHMSKIVKFIIKWKYILSNIGALRRSRCKKRLGLSTVPKDEKISKIFTHTTNEEKYKLFELASQKKGVFVEIGSYVGASSCYIAEGILSGGKKSKLYCVDTWENDAMSEGNKDTFEEFINNTREYNDIIYPLRGCSKRVSQIFDKEIDFIFIDGDHSYEGVLADVEAWFPKLKSGGLVVFHDYGWAEGVKKVVDDFVRPLILNEGQLPNMWWGWVK